MNNRVSPIGLHEGRFALCVFLLSVFGCGSEESPPRNEKENAKALGVDSEARSAARDTNGPQAAPRRNREPKRAGRDRARSRKWAAQHLYMRLALDHLELSEEQLARLSDMNWRHFTEVQKKKAERPPLREALTEMLATGVLDAQGFEQRSRTRRQGNTEAAEIDGGVE